ncbi:carboxypeptidase B [Thalassophryne amazonica]|uniref:carboxypeptidase B n=1 Tax=Thalassophryne amazonica TaxID=390379 RepID=UPI001472078B|nr:carboxypeptidase B [Thalassophryne amazonica]
MESTRVASLTANMKILLIFGLVAVALADITRFEGESVFRLKPVLDEHVTLIKEMGKSMEVDFWKPGNPEQVTIDIDVDIRVPAMYIDSVSTILQQSDMEHEVLIENLQAAVDAQTGNGVSPKAHSYTKYNTWSTIQSWITSISSSNPNLISKQVIGNTYEGRPMILLKLGKKSSSVKPAIFMDCGIHAREWISPAFCQWFVKEALSTYGSDAAMTNLLNQMDVFVLPVFNIDGYEYTHKSNRMWRKTRSRTPGTSCIGADPNRNFDAGWCTVGASSNPCSDTYCGSKPESEIEVKNVANFIRANKSIIKAYITIHSYSQLLLFPYSYTYTLAAHHSELLQVAKGAVSALTSLYGTRYTAGPGAATIYPAAGGSDDWAYDLGIRYSYTFELRDTGHYGFLLPESQIKPTCEETMLAVKYIAAYVQKNPY